MSKKYLPTVGCIVAVLSFLVAFTRDISCNAYASTQRVTALEAKMGLESERGARIEQGVLDLKDMLRDHIAQIPVCK